MDKEIEVKLPRDVAQALYETLMRPTLDREGHSVYQVTITLASEVRMPLATALEGK